MAEAETNGNAQEKKENVVETYNSIVKNAKLMDIRLVHLNYDVKPEYYTLLSASESGGSPFSHSIAQASPATAYGVEDGILIGEIGWTISARKGRKQVLRIAGKYVVMYGSVPEVDDVTATEFLRRVGKFAVYPYFRNAVSQISWAAGADLPILPVLKDI